MLAVANVFFFVFHLALILFNVLGWMWSRTRRWNLATLGLTLVSWFVLGASRGLGYCVLTDLHMRIRREMGIHDTTHGYIQLLIQSLIGWTPPDRLTMWVAGSVFVVSLFMSVTLNVRDRRRSIAS